MLMTLVWWTRSKAFLKSMNTRATDVFSCIFRFFKAKSRRLIRQCMVEEIFMLQFCCVSKRGARWECIHSEMKSPHSRLGMGVIEMVLRPLSDWGFGVLSTGVM